MPRDVLEKYTNAKLRRLNYMLQIKSSNLYLVSDFDFNDQKDNDVCIDILRLFIQASSFIHSLCERLVHLNQNQIINYSAPFMVMMYEIQEVITLLNISRNKFICFSNPPYYELEWLEKPKSLIDSEVPSDPETYNPDIINYTWFNPKYLSTAKPSNYSSTKKPVTPIRDTFNACDITENRIEQLGSSSIIKRCSIRD